jgi:hypothetical protein
VLILGGKANRIGSEVSGANVIGNNASNGVTIATADTGENIVARNFIGMRQGGARIGNLHDGVEIRGSSRNVIGGSAESSFNFISGNFGNGVSVEGNNSIANRVQGNIIGLNDTEVAPVPNLNGIVINAGSETLIGGPVTRPGAAPGNVISGNLTNGVQISPQADFTLVQGNVIGTDRANGEALALGNQTGLHSKSASTQIGGPQTAHRNIISGNRSVGVILSASATVQGNIIGLNIAGNKENVNGSNLTIERDVIALIGGELSPGTLPGQPPGNVIGGSLDLQGFRTRVLGNIVGADRTGTVRIGGGQIFVKGEENVIGSPLGANLVAGGVIISTYRSIVRGNFVGAGLNGVKFDNEGPLIRITFDGSGNLIGGRMLGEGNKLVGGSQAINNTSTFSDFSRGPNEFFGNEIRDFTQEGIHNDESFTTPPRILYAGPFSGNNSAAVALIATERLLANESAELELFSSPRLGAGGKAEAHQLLERVLLPLIGGSSNAFVSIPSFQPGQFLTATLTRPDKATSALAEPVAYSVGADSDQDGVPDIFESTTDGNKDGVPDRQQARVATAPIGLGQETMTVVVPEGFDILEISPNNVPPIDLDGPPVVETGGAVFSIKVKVAPPEGNRNRPAAAQRLSLTIFTSDGFRPNAWLMYGRTFENRDRHWYVFAYDGTSGAEILTDRIVLHIVDGEWEDERGFVDGIYEFTGTLARLGDAPLRIEQFRPLSGGDILLRWSGPLDIRLEQSGNLQMWNSLLQTNFRGANPAIILPANEADPSRFFRLRALEP